VDTQNLYEIWIESEHGRLQAVSVVSGEKTGEVARRTPWICSGKEDTAY
jgi:hypothetical protein